MRVPVLVAVFIAVLAIVGISSIPQTYEVITVDSPTFSDSTTAIEAREPEKEEPKKEKPTPLPSVGAVTALKTQPSAPVLAPTQADFERTAEMLRNALVNVICIADHKEIHSISGTGVIIDPRGTIVTNTHIGQYYLLTGDVSLGVTCTVRAGSPAHVMYQVRPMFVSSSWVKENADLFVVDEPTGTGENDFAFLAITGSATHDPLPAVFPFMPLSLGEAYTNEPLVVGSYAAQFLTSSQIQSNLYPTIAFGSVSQLYTFLKTTIDVVTVSGSVASQQGSSGGGIARGNGTLAGLITTSTTEESTAARTMGAITASYIRRAYEKETGKSLNDLFSKPPIEAAAEFSKKIPELRALIKAELSN